MFLVCYVVFVVDCGIYLCLVWFVCFVVDVVGNLSGLSFWF